MEKQLTEKLLNVTITDVKKNHSIFNEYNNINDPISGYKGKDIGEDIILDNVILGDTNPTLLAEQQKREEDRIFAEKEKQISINVEGNEVDGNGKVLRTKADIDTNINNETPEQKLQRELLEKKDEIKLDTDGNQVDEEGKIVKTKLQLEEEKNIENELPPLVDEIIQTSGITILGEDGKPKVYDDTTEGIIAYVNDLANYKLLQSQKELFKAYPDVEKYLDAKIKGIPDNEFFGTKLTDWKSVLLDETNENQQLDLVIKDLESKGIEKDRVIKMAQRIKDSGKDVLLEESKLSLQSLKSNQVINEKKKQEDFENYQKEQNQKVTDHWTNVEKIIIAGKIGEYLIPEADRKSFNDYVSLAADDDGNSAAMIARNKQSLEQRLLLDYYTFKGMNFDTLAKRAVDNKNANSLRDRIAKNNNNGKNDRVFDANTTINLNELNLNNIIRPQK